MKVTLEIDGKLIYLQKIAVFKGQFFLWANTSRRDVVSSAFCLHFL